MEVPMTMQMLRMIQGNTDGEFKKFLDGFEARGCSPRIAWYPSANEDFSPIERLTAASGEISDDVGSPAPDLFLFTDYLGGDRPFFLRRLESREMSGTVRYSWARPEELSRLDCRLDQGIVHSPDASPHIGCAAFMWVKVGGRNEPGEYRPVLYVVAENENFCARYLVRTGAVISQVIHVRYGGGCGGGGYSPGSWLVNVLKPLGCEVFVTDADPGFDPRDEVVVARYPELGPIDRMAELKLLKRIPGQDWSGHGEWVTWWRVG